MTEWSLPPVFELVWAVYMTVVTGFIVYSTYRVLRHFRQDAKLSMTRIFLDDQMPHGFKLYAAALIVYAFMIFGGVMAVQLGYNSVIYHYLSKLGGAIAVAGWAFLAHRLAESSIPTQEPSEPDEPDE